MPKVKGESTKQNLTYANVIAGKKKLLDQYLKEKQYAIKVRQVKINNWVKNEEQYNGVIQKTLLTRSNLHVPVVFEGVQTMSSKIGSAPDVKYDTVPEGDENAADIMKHVVQQDLDDSHWDQIYDDSKVEGGIYGRAVYKVIPGNDKQRVELIDTLAFLISPIARNTKTALYCGQQFIYKTITQLYEEAEEMEYDMYELKLLEENKATTETQIDSSSEASVKNIRFANMGLSNTTQYGSKVAEITEWWTYVRKGKKRDLYVLTVANDLYILRAKKVSDLGLTGKCNRMPFFSWGCYQRGITFWCPSVADVYRDPNLAVDVTLNQGIDNNTYRNFGMLFVAANSGLKQSSIVPRPLGVTPISTGANEKVQDKVWQYQPPEITQGLGMMAAIRSFADAASGLSVAPPTQKSGKLNQQQQAKVYADLELKMNTIRRNAELCCEEMYQYMADLTADKLTKPRKVKIFGYKNLTIEGVTKKNFADVELVAKAVPAEDSEQNKQAKQKNVVALYQLFKDDPKVPGQTALRRSVVKKFDVDPDEAETWFKEEKEVPQQNIEPLAEENAAPAAPGAGMSAAPEVAQQAQLEKPAPVA
jgi:hypothetical protein